MWSPFFDHIVFQAPASPRLAGARPCMSVSADAQGRAPLRGCAGALAELTAHREDSAHLHWEPPLTAVLPSTPAGAGARGAARAPRRAPRRCGECEPRAARSWELQIQHAPMLPPRRSGSLAERGAAPGRHPRRARDQLGLARPRAMEAPAGRLRSAGKQARGYSERQ